MELRQMSTPVRPTFVELADGDCVTDCGTPQSGPVVEVTSPDGGRLVMRLTPGSAVDAIGLLQSFLGRARMIQITPQMKILVALEPIDFRRGIDGLAQACRAHLQADPFSARCSYSEVGRHLHQGPGLRG